MNGEPAATLSGRRLEWWLGVAAVVGTVVATAQAAAGRDPGVMRATSPTPA